MKILASFVLGAGVALALATVGCALRGHWILAMWCGTGAVIGVTVGLWGGNR